MTEMIPVSLTQTGGAPPPTIIKGAFTYHLDNTAIVKGGKPFTVDPSAISNKGTVFTKDTSAFKNAKGNVYTLVTDAMVSKSEGILTPDPTAFIKDKKCYTIDPTAMVDTMSKSVYVSNTAKKMASQMGKKLLAQVSSQPLLLA
jgi:hypothetical protein